MIRREARGENQPSIENLIRSVESAIKWSEQIVEAEKNLNSAVPLQYKNINKDEDLGLNDYFKFLQELKNSLLEFSKTTTNKEISSLATLFLTEERSLLTKLTVKEQCLYYGTLKGMEKEDILKKIERT